jgi:hypothetical protein
VAAFAIAPPPTAAAAMAAPVTSMDLMLRICPPVGVSGRPRRWAYEVRAREVRRRSEVRAAVAAPGHASRERGTRTQCSGRITLPSSVSPNPGLCATSHT